MNKALLVLASCLAMTACQTTGMPQSQSGEQATTAPEANASQTQNSGSLTQLLAGSLSNQLGVSSTQAATGAGALLSYAQNSLSPENSQELSSLTGGLSSLDLSALTGSFKTLDSVKNAFSAIGLSPDMVSQFTPLISQVLESQGASSSLLSGLSALW